MKNRFLLDFVTPERSILRYMIGTAALTVAVQIFYDLAKETFGIPGGLLLAVLLIGTVFLIIWIDYRHFKSVARLKPEDAPIQAHRGLIVMVSPKNTEVPMKAIEHHLAALKHCWLVATKGSLATAVEIASEIRRQYPEVEVHDARPAELVDPEYTQSTWQLVESIYAKANEFDLTEADIVADITGGLKPMTAGMALACLPRNRTMQYIKTVRDENGNPVKDAPPVAVKISIQATTK